LFFVTPEVPEMGVSGVIFFGRAKVTLGVAIEERSFAPLRMTAKGGWATGRGFAFGVAIEEGSFVAKGAPPACAKKDVGYGGQAG
jgi:hypothetical protein